MSAVDVKLHNMSVMEIILMDEQIHGTRVPTVPGKPGKMTVTFSVMEI